ncbi:hypothetical protein C8F04DRAFT_1291557 [Mycena alexandri]|uniref:Uncharacterized protein n=1 Tax=Mycena alexandri TaxID=1745969 RepID=A0AAD6WYJ6_9AGAR|nr:hypothetical protein C8F04DRAFT_1291557 [Mycena alexandri]
MHASTPPTQGLAARSTGLITTRCVTRTSVLFCHTTPALVAIASSSPPSHPLPASRTPPHLVRRLRRVLNARGTVCRTPCAREASGTRMRDLASPTPALASRPLNHPRSRRPRIPRVEYALTRTRRGCRAHVHFVPAHSCGGVGGLSSLARLTRGNAREGRSRIHLMHVRMPSRAVGGVCVECPVPNYRAQRG